MTRARRPSSTQAGYSLVELLVSTAIMITVTGAIFSLMNPAQGSSKSQPEVADMQQRMRVGNDTLFKELIMSGAGPYQGPITGALVQFFAPILPRRLGRVNPDPATVFKEDTITLSYIPNSYSQTTISQLMPNVSAELKVSPQNNCPPDTQESLCGFHEGMDVIIFDTSGNFDFFTITQVQDAAAHMQHRGQDMSVPYNSGASITQIVSNTYYLNRDTHKLMRYNLNDQETPLVDDVVDLKFEYFGDPNPPMAPKPALGVANCVIDAGGNPRLPVLAADEGSLAPLTAAILTDGPMCGGGTNQFDADLLRIRKVRVTMRMQVADPTLRGTDTTLWKNPSKGRTSGGERYVPDYSLSFEVSPRNLNLVR